MKLTDSQYKEKTKKKTSRKGSHWGEEGITGRYYWEWKRIKELNLIKNTFCICKKV